MCCHSAWGSWRRAGHPATRAASRRRLLLEHLLDPAFITQVLGTIARSRNMNELARRGMSREGLYKALSADGNPSFATIMKVAKALGLKIEFHPVA